VELFLAYFFETGKPYFFTTSFRYLLMARLQNGLCSGQNTGSAPFQTQPSPPLLLHVMVGQPV
jgi:hypothetical protein